MSAVMGGIVISPRGTERDCCCVEAGERVGAKVCVGTGTICSTSGAATAVRIDEG